MKKYIKRAWFVIVLLGVGVGLTGEVIVVSIYTMFKSVVEAFNGSMDNRPWQVWRDTN